jgi:hypothetical protein
MTTETNAKAKLPHNIQEFNEITAVVFSQLYISHPLPKTIEPDEVADTLGISRTGMMPSGRAFDDVFSNTVAWLVQQQYISRACLTDKALSAMNVVPPSLGQSRGSQLVDATKQARSENGRGKLVELVGTFFGSIFKTMIE